MVGGLPTVRLTRAQFAEQLAADWRAQQAAGRQLPPKVAFSSNGQALALTATSAAYKAAMAAANYIHADGMWVVLASRWLTRTPLPERIATTDFFHDAARIAMRDGLKFFLLGGTETENRAAFEAVQKQYPTLQIVGCQHGYWPQEAEPALLATIRQSGADVLWVNLGKPRQEEFCLKYRDQLSGITWLKTCGGLYKFLGGLEKRAPLWMQNLGLEWLHRLVYNPKRLFWRYFTTNIVAVWLLLTRTRNQA